MEIAPQRAQLGPAFHVVPDGSSSRALPLRPDHIGPGVDSPREAYIVIISGIEAPAEVNGRGAGLAGTWTVNARPLQLGRDMPGDLAPARCWEDSLQADFHQICTGLQKSSEFGLSPLAKSGVPLALSMPGAFRVASSQLTRVARDGGPAARSDWTAAQVPPAA
jgi:hypothetical protein